MYSLYPKIVQKIYKTLKKLNLRLLSEKPEIFVEKKLRFYHASCQTKNKKKVFFKSLLKRERGIRNRFQNEISFLSTIKKNPSHSLFKITPKLLDYSLDRRFPYLLYEFLPGKAHQRIDKFSSEEIKKIARLIRLINSSQNIFRFIPKDSPFAFSRYKNKIIFLASQAKIEKSLEEKIKTFIEENKQIFSEVKPVLSHGDFSEANLIFFKEKIKIIDWEHIHLRNPSYDFVSFWTKRKHRPNEQKELKREYLKKEKDTKSFEILFDLALIEICLRNLIFFGEMLKILEKEEENLTVKRAKKSRKKEIKETLNLLKNI